MSEKGIPDIIGTLPSLGRALYIELKAPGKAPSDDQLRFLAAHEAAGALAFWTADPREVVRRLAVAGYGPAKAIDVQLMGRGGAA